MLTENIDMILSILSTTCFVVTVLVNTIKKIIESKTNNYNKLKRREIQSKLLPINAKKISHEIVIHNLAIEDHVQFLYDKVNELYSYAQLRISIRMLKEVNEEKPEESKVITYYNYPKDVFDKTYSRIYTVKNNTDLNSIYIKKHEYFFVSNLKEFGDLGEYISEYQNNLYNWNTSIVYPIDGYDENKRKKVLIAFLCIESTGEFNDVKKNEIIIEYVKKTSDKLFISLQSP